MPDRLALVKGAPALRRSHLDGFCAALWPARDEHRRRYSRALAQRNALLGRIRAGAAGESSLDAWDAELAAAGRRADRRARRSGRPAGGAVRRAPPRRSASRARRASRTGRGARPRTSTTLVAELAERRASDLRRGYSGWGPHLDELALEVGGRSIRRYASQGQQRVSLLALLFAERRVLLDDGRPAPLMLLDDVTSELDARRRELLVEQLSGGGQSLITATEPGPPAGARRSGADARSRCATAARSPPPRPRERRRRRAAQRSPRAVRAVRDSVQPQTLLAAVEAAWPRAAGEEIAANAAPVVRARRGDHDRLRRGDLGAGARPAERRSCSSGCAPSSARRSARTLSFDSDSSFATRPR